MLYTQPSLKPAPCFQKTFRKSGRISPGRGFSEGPPKALLLSSAKLPFLHTIRGCGVSDEEDSFGCHNWGRGASAIWWVEARMLASISQCTDRLPATQAHPATAATRPRLGSPGWQQCNDNSMAFLSLFIHMLMPARLTVVGSKGTFRQDAFQNHLSTFKL